MRTFISLLILTLSGCALAPKELTPPGWTQRTWQLQANHDCAEALAVGIEVPWKDPMIVIDRHGFHREKRVDIIRRPGADCMFTWGTNTCSCDVSAYTNGGTGSAHFATETITFNGCAALHQQGKL